MKQQLISKENRENIENLIPQLLLFGEKIQEVSDKITCDDYIKLHGVIRTSPEGKYFLRCITYARNASDDLFVAAARLRSILDDEVAE